MRFTNSQGYALDISVNAFPEVKASEHEYVVGLAVVSPRSAYFISPRPVDRYAVHALALHFRAMLDGLVDVADPDGDNGYASFDELGFQLRQLRQVPAADADISFEVSLDDCGCTDEAGFGHSGFFAVYCEREYFAAQIEALEAAARRPCDTDRES